MQKGFSYEIPNLITAYCSAKVQGWILYVKLVQKIAPFIPFTLLTIAHPQQSNFKMGLEFGLVLVG
jgi:hypothetical protein